MFEAQMKRKVSWLGTLDITHYNCETFVELFLIVCRCVRADHCLSTYVFFYPFHGIPSFHKSSTPMYAEN